MPHECNTSNTNATQLTHECNTSATQVQHECYTNDTSATRVLHERHDCDTSENFDFVTARVKTYFHTLIFCYMASERLQGEEQFDSKNYFLKIVSFPCQNTFKKCTTKTKLFNGKSYIKKLYSRL